ncbi:MAG: hypothetical protein KKE64_01795, partial [Candidatus Omnitrophica bacterium]|nr:hypothetical protein [Candidatus Omnitrophota bacterium]
MAQYNSRTLRNIEAKIDSLEEGSVRYQVLQNAKNFKTSWVELGRSLYTVHRDKLYKEWGYSVFENYASKEIGIKKDTAMKLLRSYYFLEKEEPDYLKEDFVRQAQTASVPNYESVNLLRLAKNKKALDETDYKEFRKQVFEKGKDARELKKDLTAIIRQRLELEPEEAR